MKKELQSNIKSSDQTIKDAIREGDLIYFLEYCEKRNKLDLAGSKYVKLTTYGKQKNLTNAKLVKNICNSQHDNSSLMLEILLQHYSGDNRYLITKYRARYFIYLLKACKESNNSLELSLKKFNILLDHNVEMNTLADWKGVVKDLNDIEVADDEIKNQISQLLCRFKGLFKFVSNSLVLTICGSHYSNSLDDLKFLVENQLLSNDMVEKMGILWLLEIVDTLGDTNEAIELALNKLEILFENGALTSVEKNEELCNLLFNKMEMLLGKLVKEKRNFELIQKTAFLFARLNIVCQTIDQKKKEIEKNEEGIEQLVNYLSKLFVNTSRDKN